MSAGTRTDLGTGASDSPTAVLTPIGDDRTTRGPDVGDRFAGASAAARDRVAGLDGNAKLAWVGAGLAALAFLVLPYAGSRGQAAEIGGRLWWRPILALAAAALVTAAARRRTGTTSSNGVTVAAVAVAAAATTEAGLFGLVSSTASANLRIGFFVMLLGAVLVLVAAIRTAVSTDR